jgi:hypothetical protein
MSNIFGGDDFPPLDNQPGSGDDPYFDDVEPEFTIYGVSWETQQFIPVGTMTKQDWFEEMTSNSPDEVRALHGGMGIPDIIRQLHALGYWTEEDKEALDLELYGEQ